MKSQKLAKAKKPVKVQTINNELDKMSKRVIEYFKESQAILITTKSELHDYINKMIQARFGAIDTETTGLDRIHDTIVGASLYYPGGVECYIPSRHLVPIFDAPYKNQLTYEEIGEELQRLVDNDVKLVFANADFDMAMIYKDFKVDLIPICYYDVIIAWRCLKENEKHNGLKALYNKYVLKGKGDPMKFSDFFSPQLFPYCNPNVAKLYAANDAKITYELFQWQLPYIQKENKKCQKNDLEALSDLIWGVEFPLMAICQKMHRHGVYLDKSMSNMLRKKYAVQSEREYKKLIDMVSGVLEDTQYHTNVKCPFIKSSDFNPDSVPHVKWLCYDLLKLGNDKTKGTGKEILGTFNHPIAKQILKCRSLTTLISTFVEKLPDATSSDSRIHCQFKQIGADCITGDSIIPTDYGYSTLREICEPAEYLPAAHIDINPINIVNLNQKSESAVGVIKYENYPTIKITTDYGFTIEGTYNHPIMVSSFNKHDITRNHSVKNLNSMWDNRYFKQLCDIKIGDIVEIPCNYKVGGEYQKTNLIAASSTAPNSNVATIPEYFNEIFAEFLGMYHADGSANYKNGTYRIQLSNCNPDVISRYCDLSKELFGITPVVWEDKNRENEVAVYINSKSLSCMHNLLPHGAMNKKIPKEIWYSPKSVINAYIKGMTLDSSVHYQHSNKGRIVFELNVNNEEDVRLLQMHLASQGVLCSIVHHCRCKHGNIPRLKFNADNYVLFSGLIGFIESNKYKETTLNQISKYNNLRIGDSFRVGVKSIEYKTNDVYDLHVPETHSFISNGMISHNTGRMSSADPNLQNIPSKHGDIRRMFRATPGYVLLSSDYSLRMLAV